MNWKAAEEARRKWHAEALNMMAKFPQISSIKLIGLNDYITSVRVKNGTPWAITFHVPLARPQEAVEKALTAFMVRRLTNQPLRSVNGPIKL